MGDFTDRVRQAESAYKVWRELQDAPRGPTRPMQTPKVTARPTTRKPRRRVSSTSGR
jgi:hypothetical protein